MNFLKQINIRCTLGILFLISCSSVQAESIHKIPLNGRWRFALDEQKEGVTQSWYKSHDFTHSIALPGTTDEAGYGNKPPKPSMVEQYNFGWSRPVWYEGMAWYERDVVIPQTWQGKEIELFLEQTRCSTTIWVDGKLASGKENSLATSHRHPLTKALTPGLHKITMLLDNSLDTYVGGSYIRSVMGQGNWHGVVGDVELRAYDPIHIDYVRFDSKDGQKGEIQIVVKNQTGKSHNMKGVVRFLDETKELVRVPFSQMVAEQTETVSLAVDLSKMERWSQFNPKLYDLKIDLFADDYYDTYQEAIGVRIVGRNKEHYITINNHPTFLRGTVDYNTFPMTGYPSAEVADWLRIFHIYKQWGMNHVRFHSLTPPEAAFIAADQLGIYLQCECPRAGVIHASDSQNAFQISEGRRILKDYGNHPSFIMMSMGNELAGSKVYLNKILAEVSKNETRRIFTATSGGRDLSPFHDDYKVSGNNIRGVKDPQTDWNYQPVVDSMNTTLISHEVGQWFVYPQLDIISKYNGVMRPSNLLLIREELQTRDLLQFAPEWTQITGKFSTALYKEEFEAIMRTRGISGFQMLMLRDFPSQGTATVGMLDVFEHEKGFVAPAEFREFVAPVVPLARMPKRVYKADELFTFGVDLSNFTEGVVGNGILKWSLQDEHQVYYEGMLKSKEFPAGKVYSVGEISTPLTKIKTAKRLELVVRVDGTSYRNRWNIWVYPTEQAKPIPSDVHVTTTWKETQTALKRGEKVLFLPSTQEVAQWRPGAFKDVFWCPVWLKRGPETMSVWAHPEHLALSGFPTERQTDWQWFGPLENSFTMSIDKLPISFEPIVGVIDSFRKSQRLANIFEAQVGEGKLMVCSINLLNNLEGDLARINLRNSILDYLSSSSFEPKQKLTLEQLAVLFTKCVKSQEKEFKAMSKATFRQKAGEMPSIQHEGYSMEVTSSKVVESAGIVAWADKRDILLQLNCPKSEDGVVYLFMQNTMSDAMGNLKTPQEVAQTDWIDDTLVEYGNHINRPVSALMIGNEVGEYIETISNFGVRGKWYAMPVKAEQMHDGVLDLKISTLNLPNVLVEFAFVPKGF